MILALPLSVRNALSFKEMPHKSWYTKFLKRHPVLSLKKSEYLSASRAKVTEARIRDWFQRTEKVLVEDDCFEILADGNRVFYCDESAIWLNPNSGKVISKKGETAYRVSPNSDKMSVTILFTIRANGSFVPSYILHKGVRISQAYRQALPSEWKMRSTPNGWMTCDSFLFYIEHVFDEYLVRNEVKKPVILFLDNHVSHLSMETTEYCTANGIILVCLLPSTTHLKQPLDVSVNKAFKAKYVSALSKFRLVKKRDISKPELPEIIDGILHSNDFSESIRNGFRKCGLYPWDADALDYSKCRFADVENLPLLEAVPKTFMDLLEERIAPDLLATFRLSVSDVPVWNGDVRHESLYELWRACSLSNSSFVTASTPMECDSTPTQASTSVETDTTLIRQSTSSENTESGSIPSTSLSNTAAPFIVEWRYCMGDVTCGDYELMLVDQSVSRYEIVDNSSTELVEEVDVLAEVTRDAVESVTNVGSSVMNSNTLEALKENILTVVVELTQDTAENVTNVGTSVMNLNTSEAPTGSTKTNVINTSAFSNRNIASDSQKKEAVRRNLQSAFSQKRVNVFSNGSRPKKPRAPGPPSSRIPVLTSSERLKMKREELEAKVAAEAEATQLKEEAKKEREKLRNLREKIKTDKAVDRILKRADALAKKEERERIKNEKIQQKKAAAVLLKVNMNTYNRESVDLDDSDAYIEEHVRHW